MRGDRINDPVNISSDESADSSSNEAVDTSFDEPAYTSSDEGVDMSSDERAYSSSDDGMDTSSDEGIFSNGMCYCMKKKRLQKTCKDVCDCPREYSVGVDKRAAITHNWSRFVERAKLKEREICVFSLRHCKGVPVFTVHKI
ncbi:hypothetical protein CFC21_001805 [Triticum aestivum]|uniref:TF-B3 domain-containing protein n=1 Tax=Triticum aestivum TaxID=4565 RepID=A0A3B5XYZ4_WHEAT|nr:hypothetical protein CFC21_001805 [Triticum aestivum]